MRAGQSLRVVCDSAAVPGSLDDQGAAVADVATGEGNVGLHVAGALPGEDVTAVVEHVSPHLRAGRREAWGRVASVHQESPWRRPPVCPAHGRCGGCPVAALAYERQVAWKHAKVVRALEGVLPAAQILPCVPSPITLGYRNQAKLTYGRDAAGRALLGAYAPRSHQVVDVAGCKLIEAPLEAVANTIRAHLAHRGVRPHEAQVPGDLRHVVLRANGAGQVLVTLVAAHANPAVARLAEGIMGTHVEVTGVVLNLNPDPGDVIFGGEEQVLAGTGHVNDRIVGVPVKLSSRAFFQINRQVAALVYEAVDSLARAHGRFEVAVEVYAGAGIIAQKLAAHAPRVVAIEDNPSSGVALGDAGAALEYLAADAAVGLSALKRADLVVLNPPRGGCDPAVLAQMARLRPRVVAYLSCNPTTLARDLTTLNGLGVGPGMGTSTVRPFDMLPHTSHVEVLTFFTSV